MKEIERLKEIERQKELDRLKGLVKDFCEERDWDQFHNPKELAIGLSTEANELLQLFRFQSEEQMREMLGKPDTREQIEDETADIFFFLLRFAQKNGIDLEQALVRKIEKNRKKYPAELARGNNLKYTEYE
ncbi:nucleotide pyrophosphohydrolase [Lachnospiraceae bacterium ASD3451]|uniref:nucleotide pyrophosphohydrolase n=1 Tax=Diplocloster agilis TaxID=2850323 RepID=UPI001E12B43B|nr:nucleotide pyrophosphohydrolase [Diplocloster agilis]MBU9742881.1 nucleotide pyrophosphohydrolase [Diplocloster agilis]